MDEFWAEVAHKKTLAIDLPGIELNLSKILEVNL